MMNKTLLIITDNLLDQINGVATTFRNIEQYAELDGFNVHYITPTDFRYITAPGYPEVKLALPIGIGKKIKDINPDHIHIATEGPVGLAARLSLDAVGIKYNTSYHTKFPEFLKEMYHVPPSITYAYLRWFHKHSGIVLTTTQTMVDELKQHGFNDSVIPWTRGVNRELFKPDSSATCDYLLCVTRVSKEKNLDAFCKLPFPKKIIVGDGPYRAELQKKYPEVEFTGMKLGSELASYYQNASVFVFPSMADTFGIVMIEAMACGTPVAAYPVTGPVDVINEGVTGFMSDNLEYAIEQCKLLDRASVAIGSQTWSWENCWTIFKKNLVDKY